MAEEELIIPSSYFYQSLVQWCVSNNIWLWYTVAIVENIIHGESSQRKNQLNSKTSPAFPMWQFDKRVLIYCNASFSLSAQSCVSQEQKCNISALGDLRLHSWSSANWIAVERPVWLQSAGENELTFSVRFLEELGEDGICSESFACHWNLPLKVLDALGMKK